MRRLNNVKTRLEKLVLQRLLSEGSDQPGQIAFRHMKGRKPHVIWLGGFKSDMRSVKSQAIATWSKENNRSYWCFDYSGHGESATENEGERFIDGCISRWLSDAKSILRHIGEPVIVVGSSMGGWIALLLEQALRNTRQVKGLLLIAPAVDFTEHLLWAKLPENIRDEIETQGAWTRVLENGEVFPITKKLIYDGRNNLLLGQSIEPACPVHIIQGALDPDVPMAFTLKVMQHMPQHARLTIVKDGNHRLSRASDLELLTRTLEQMLVEVQGDLP